MGSSICSRLRKLRKNLSKSRNVDEETASLKVNKEGVSKDTFPTEKLRELIREEADDGVDQAVLYTNEDLEELIGDLEEQLQKLRSSGPERDKPKREKLCLDLGHAYFKLCKFKTAKDYYEQYFNLVKRHRSLPRLQRAYCNLGCVHRRLGEYDKAAEFLENGLAIAEDLQDSKCQGRLYNNLGNICEMQKDFQGAIYYHSKRRRMAEVLKDGDSEAKACASIANSHHCMGNLRKSIAYYERVVLWLKRKLAYEERRRSRLDLVSQQPMEDEQWV